LRTRTSIAATNPGTPTVRSSLTATTGRTGSGLRGHDRREFVAWCTDRGRTFARHDWDQHDWDRIRWFRDRYRDRYRDDWRWQVRDDWDRDDWDDQDFVRLLNDDPYWYYMRYNNDWRYAALQDFIGWSLRN
jgi:hypothetical protein